MMIPNSKRKQDTTKHVYTDTKIEMGVGEVFIQE